MSDVDLELLVPDLTFPEGLRWHDDRLWLSDMHSHRILCVDAGGRCIERARLEDDMPSGLGWLPDGTMVAVSMRQRQLVAVGDGQTSLYADLQHLPGRMLNDMVVDAAGRAYVGARAPRRLSASNLDGRASSVRDCILVVFPGGESVVAADDVIGPNGSCVTADGRTLIVAETHAHRIQAFDIGPDGHLSNQRLYADVDPFLPDGIAIDAEGGVWFGSPVSGVFARVVEGGRITDRIDLPAGDWAVCCALGGPDRRTLFLGIARTTLENLASLRNSEADALSTSVGWVARTRVAIPGVGLP